MTAREAGELAAEKRRSAPRGGAAGVPEHPAWLRRRGGASGHV